MNELRRVPSPGGWNAPEGKMAGWDWLPPGGGHLKLERAPFWVRRWYNVVYADRFAHVWLWEHGCYDVLPR